jgi:hypothetical protein
MADEIGMVLGAALVAGMIFVGLGSLLIKEIALWTK